MEYGRIREAEYQGLRRFLRETEDGEGRTSSLLRQALREELTERQYQIARLYFVEQHSMREIAQELHVNPSTVSRSLRSSRERLRRALRYGAKRLLEEAKE